MPLMIVAVRVRRVPLDQTRGLVVFGLERAATSSYTTRMLGHPIQVTGVPTKPSVTIKMIEPFKVQGEISVAREISALFASLDNRR